MNDKNKTDYWSSKYVLNSLITLFFNSFKTQNQNSQILKQLKIRRVHSCMKAQLLQ